MRTQLRLTRDGDLFVARLAPSQVAAMFEALSYLSGYGDAQLALLVGAGREDVDALLERMAGPHTRSRDFRLTVRELHTLHSALVAAPTMFLVNGGVFAEEPFHIRLGFYRENFDVLAHAIVQAAAEGDT
ncbi:hypothetical protein [Streptomyces sp. NPDC002553]|uniref:hypothetical protein n=1 Tax=Streptomyces sp. NPDC002553 TaxID=3154417 RepID=UPI0033249556